MDAAPSESSDSNAKTSSVPLSPSDTTQSPSSPEASIIATLREPSDEELDAAVAHYRAKGWARVGTLATPATLEALRARVDAIMMGNVVYDGLFFQHDSDSGNYDDLAYGEGWQGPSLRYRKIEKLEKDPLFWAWMTQPVFQRIARKVHPEAFTTLDPETAGNETNGNAPNGDGSGIAIYRAFLMNKHAGGGSNLPFHQDGGNFWGLDRNPVLQIWTGLDDAPLDGGCVEVVEGTHMAGLATPLGGVVPHNHLSAKDADARALPLPTVAGEVLLIHNHVWHRSARSRTGNVRRAMSVCYMNAATRCVRKKRAPRQFVRVF